MLFPFSLSYSQFHLVSILYPGMHLSHTEVDRAFMRITSFHKENPERGSGLGGNLDSLGTDRC